MSELLEYDNQLRDKYPIIAGFDEVGRGPLAGPVVAAAVVLPANTEIPGVDDSKKITKKKHKDIAKQILSVAIDVQVGVVNASEIDNSNILEADKQAMLQALSKLQIEPNLLLIDGNTSQLLDTPHEQKTQVKGDSHSLSIAAASIVAKAIRDELMKGYAKKYPGYGFETNSGYGTKQHMTALEQYGITPIHRLTFAPIKNNLDKWPRNEGINTEKTEM